ncbi:MAG: zf-HC2 domain-containing protein, partial [Gemmatimonadaceae bacterium]
MTHETYLEMAAAHALGALAAEERAAFDLHVASCAECRAAVVDYMNVAGMLALAVPPVAPRNDAALRSRIVRGATAVRPIIAARNAPARRNLVPWLAAAACLTIAVASGLAWTRDAARADQLQRELAAAREGIAKRDSTIAAFFGPEVHVVSLSEPEQKPKMRV